ncbi:MAG: HAD-IA family hydrolase [Fimbriimonadaceae bacterium]|nr:HAD-IA family hydrolase [Fimbriimonadaceae bacterium]
MIPDPNDFDAVLFDMDGVVIDSEPLWEAVEVETYRSLGVPMTPELSRTTLGLTAKVAVQKWYDRYGWEGPSVDEVVEAISEKMEPTIRDHGREVPGACDLVRRVRAMGKRTALATSSPYRLVDATLDRLNLRDAFDLVYSGTEEPLGKPHPGIFLTVASRLGVPAGRCLVIEDAVSGCVAAKAARMMCVALPADYPNHSPKYQIADWIVGGLDGLFR